MDLNLRSLRCFLQVVETGHFGRAAEVLYISPPALTQQIQRLEAQLGVVLLERGDHPIRLTRAGAAFAREAEAIVAAVDRACAAALRSKRDVGNTLRVGFVANLVGPLTQPILTAFRIGHPEVLLELVEVPLARQVAAVRQGDVDACFIRPPVDRVGAVFEPVLREPRCILMHLSNSLAGRAAATLDDVRDEITWRTSDELVDERWARWWPEDPRPGGCPVRYGPKVQSIPECTLVAASGQAIGIVAQSLADELTGGTIVSVPLLGVSPAGVDLCLPPGELPTRHQQFREVVRDVAQEYRARQRRGLGQGDTARLAAGR